MLKQVSAFAEDSSSKGNIATSVISTDVEKMEKKDVCNDSLKSSEKVKTLPTKTSVKLGSKGTATAVILTLTIVKDMNYEYLPQCCLNQQFKCNKQKSSL